MTVATPPAPPANSVDVSKAFGGSQCKYCKHWLPHTALSGLLAGLAVKEERLNSWGRCFSRSLTSGLKKNPDFFEDNKIKNYTTKTSVVLLERYVDDKKTEKIPVISTYATFGCPYFKPAKK